MDEPRRALVFDMDGTLIESSTVIPDAYIATISALGGGTFSRQNIIDAYSIGPPEAMLNHFLGRASSPQEVGDYHERLFEKADEVTVYDGIGEALPRLRSSVPLAVFTGASLRACRTLLEAAGLLSHFDVLVGADEVAHSKPEPDGIHLACARLGVVASLAAYVGDAPNDLEAARRSGATAVAARWGHQYRREAPSDVVLNHPRELINLVRPERVT